MKKNRILLFAAVLLAVGIATVFWKRQETVFRPHLPAMLQSSLPPKCQQVLLVLVPDENSVSARLWRMERQGDSWQPFGEMISCTIGVKGLAWGDGEHTAPAPAGFRIKHEGDKCSPAGVFQVPFAFGMAPAAAGLSLPYTPLTPTIIGVDDPKSRYYNQVVDSAKVERDWDSNEAMQRYDRLYEWGAFVGHNPKHIPGGGSCIFLHVWPGPGKGTAGCTAMSVEDLKVVLAWLDPAKEPRLVQGLESW